MRPNMRLNIVTQLVCFISLALLADTLYLAWLLIMLSFLLLGLCILKQFTCLPMLKRYQSLFIVMLFIITFTTPGEHVHQWPFAIGPTYEGLLLAVTQIARILLIIIALSLILNINTRQQLISGFYTLLSPLQLIGVKVDRFAARLWLTLHYVETQSSDNPSKDLLTRLKSMLTNQASETNEMADENAQIQAITVTLEKPIFNRIDYCALIILIFLFIYKVLFYKLLFYKVLFYKVLVLKVPA